MTDQAPANRQYVACVFREGDARSYTYHNDGEPVAVGDRVRILDRKGGEQSVTVAALPAEMPPFPTKPIIGKALPEGEAPANEAPAAQPISSTPLPF